MAVAMGEAACLLTMKSIEATSGPDQPSGLNPLNPNSLPVKMIFGFAWTAIMLSCAVTVASVLLIYNGDESEKDIGRLVPFDGLRCRLLTKFGV